MSINWDNFKRTDDRWKPENPGDTITGVITAMRVATMPDGTDIPSINIRTAEGEREVLISQSQLLQKMAALQPKIGDNITIRFTDIEKLTGGKTLKKFEVSVDTKANREDTIL